MFIYKIRCPQHKKSKSKSAISHREKTKSARMSDRPLESRQMSFLRRSQLTLRIATFGTSDVAMLLCIDWQSVSKTRGMGDSRLYSTEVNTHMGRRMHQNTHQDTQKLKKVCLGVLRLLPLSISHDHDQRLYSCAFGARYIMHTPKPSSGSAPAFASIVYPIKVFHLQLCVGVQCHVHLFTLN